MAKLAAQNQRLSPGEKFRFHLIAGSVVRKYEPATLGESTVMFLNRRVIRKIFNAQIPKGSQGKELTAEYVCFVRGLLMGCGWEAKEWGDFVDFKNEFDLKTDHWQLFFKKHKEENMWAVLEKHENATRVAFFKDGIRKTDWQPL